MELKIGAQELAKALGRSQGIVEKKSTMPILSHVLIEARKAGQLVVSATDLDLAVSSEHACEVLKEGSLAVSARHLYRRRSRGGPGRGAKKVQWARFGGSSKRVPGVLIAEDLNVA
jgi:hypothetical protein